MRNKCILISIFIAAAALAAMSTNARAVEPGNPGVMLQSATLFDYEKLAPLDDKVTLMEEQPQVTRYKVEFTSTNGLRVPGYYYIPKHGKKPLPCIIFMHGAGGSKEDLIIGYQFMAIRGFAVLALDAALHGERKVPGLEPDKTDWYQTRAFFIQTVIDMRRAVDWLETRPEIDPSRIGYFGASQGSIIGTVFVGVEKRIACAFFLIGGADFHILFRHSQLPSLTIVRNYATDAEIDRMADDMAAVDPQYYIGAISPRPVFLMNGRKDLIISPEASARLQELAREPKETAWYDGPHLPPFDKVIVLAAKFYKKNLMQIKPYTPLPEMTKEIPVIKFNLARDLSSPLDRVITVTASADKLPPGGALAIDFPTLSPRSMPLFDDGTHGDVKAGDGTWTFKYSLGPRAPDLDLVGGDQLYECRILALDSYGRTLTAADAGWLTAEAKIK
jgi:uncharacterized protein